MTGWTPHDKLKVGSSGKVRLLQAGRMGERVWYIVTEVLGDYKFKVKLDNQPFNIDLNLGDIIEITDDSPTTVPFYRVETRINYKMMKAIAEEIVEMELEYSEGDTFDFPIKIIPSEGEIDFEVTVRAVDK